MAKPSPGTYLDYYKTYINLVDEDQVLDALKNQKQIVASFLYTIPIEKADYAYAPGKWTLKDVIQHMIDTERIFGTRALCIARGETQSLPGYDENAYADMVNTADFSLNDMAEELIELRNSSIRLFSHFTESEMHRTGNANNHALSVEAAGFIMAGHIYHHMKVIQEKYL